MYTLDQAQEACKEHEHLIGSPIKKGWRITGVIEAVIVAPLDGINQYKFLKEYRDSGNAKRSLKFYTGILHTVLLVIRSIQCKNDLFTITLEKYLEENHSTLGHAAEKPMAVQN